MTVQAVVSAGVLCIWNRDTGDRLWLDQAEACAILPVVQAFAVQVKVNP